MAGAAARMALERDPQMRASAAACAGASATDSGARNVIATSKATPCASDGSSPVSARRAGSEKR